ncbi:1232_t:CDS:2, partial [Funneliformis geosporum]
MITIAKILIANNSIVAVKEIRSIRKWSYETFAERTGVHAVWAGWEHVSKNPKLRVSLAQSEHKMVFISPLNSAMCSLGDKISSMIVAQSANFPTMDWSEACIKDVDDGLNKANVLSGSKLQRVEEKKELEKWKIQIILSNHLLKFKQ